MDYRLSWRQHIDLTVARMRKLVWVFKNLRHVAEFSLLRTVYYALAQSVFGYCIEVWGGACKTLLIQLERAQRLLLKVMTFKPFRFSTKLLYEKCQVLTVRQLYIHQLMIKQHKTTPYITDKYNEKRSIPNVCEPVKCRTATGKRQQGFMAVFLYNKINRIINIYPLQTYEVKSKIKNWLLGLDYEQTEQILKCLL